MESRARVTATMTVREVMTKYPGAEAIFNKHGLTGCGGPNGPVEPIGFFARVHQVDPDVLLTELNQLAAAGSADARPSEPPAPVQADIYRAFVKTAIVVTLTAGCTLGAVTLLAMALGGSVATAWTAITQAHGYAQIFGWVGLFIMGVAYHVLPRLKATELRARPLALASYWFVVTGIALRLIAQPLAAYPLFGSLMVMSALSQLVAALLFVYVVARTLAGSQQPTDFYEKYIIASAGWFLLLSLATVALAADAVRKGLDYFPAALDAPYLHIGLLGFVAMMIFGITLRTIPLFMGLRAPNKRTFGVIFWTLNLGIVIRASTGFWNALYNQQPLVAQAEVLGAILEYGALASFVYFLNLFRRPELDITEAGATRGYEKFIRAAYAWLLVAATMSTAYSLFRAATGQEVPHALVGAYRHALTVGFISIMIMGMAYRIIPVFTGVRLHSQGFLFISFVLINLGNGLRVLSQPLADAFGGVFFGIMGISGFIEVLALALFGYNVWKTMDSPVAEVAKAPAAGTITKDMVVAEVLEQVPQTLNVFLEYGFTPLNNPLGRRTLAKAITIEQACRLRSVNLENFLAELERVRVAVSQSQERPAEPMGLPVEKGHIVGELIEKYPRTLEVFLRRGFTHLSDEAMRRKMAKMVTIEMASRVHGVDLDGLLAELNEVCAARGASQIGPRSATSGDATEETILAKGQ